MFFFQRLLCLHMVNAICITFAVVVIATVAFVVVAHVAVVNEPSRLLSVIRSCHNLTAACHVVFILIFVVFHYCRCCFLLFLLLL